MTVINGKSYWAQVVAPSTKFDEGGVYSIDVSVDAENKKKAEADGLTIKNKGDERGDFVSIKRKATRKDGTQNRAPEIKDNMKRPLEGVLIGNGSTVNVLYRMYDWKWGGNSGKSAELQAIQVVDLVPYVDKEVDEAFQEIPKEGEESNDFATNVA